jgi:arginine exporter protein ArgO
MIESEHVRRLCRLRAARHAADAPAGAGHAARAPQRRPRRHDGGHRHHGGRLLGAVPARDAVGARPLGAAYLVWLGIQSLLRLRRPRGADGAPLVRRALPTATALRQGFLSNALNPKTATFYLALLPQFATLPERALADSLALAGIHFGIAFAWLALLSALVERSRRLLARAWLARAADLVTGAALLAFGVRLALARR